MKKNKLIIIMITLLCLVGCSNKTIKPTIKDNKVDEKETFDKISNDIKFETKGYDSKNKTFNFKINNTSSIAKNVSYFEIIFMSGKDDVYTYRYDFNDAMQPDFSIEIGAEIVFELPKITDYKFNVYTY